MAYDEALAARVRKALQGTPDVVEKKMFGGLAFMVRGNMCCGVNGEDLMLRVGPEQYDAGLALPHAREMDFTGRALKGMVYVGPAGYRSDASLSATITLALNFVTTLPAK